MKHKFLQLAQVRDENEFYSKYPTQDSFFKAFPKAKDGLNIQLPEQRRAPQIDTTINTGKTFGDAFKEARKTFLKGTGDKIFTYKGKKYTIDLKDDLHKKEYHTPEERNTYAAHIQNTVNNKPNNLFNQEYYAKQQAPSSEDIYNQANPYHPTINPIDHSADSIYRQRNQDVNEGKYSYKGAGKDVSGNINWSNSVLDPAMTTMAILDVPFIAADLAKFGVQGFAKYATKKSKDAVKAAMIKQGIKATDESMNAFFKDNLQQAKKMSPYPINQWKTTPGEFEWQGDSPITQWSNSPTLLNSETSGLSPLEQMNDMEHAWSPIQRVGGQQGVYDMAKKAYPENFQFEEEGLSPMEQMGRKKIEALSKKAQSKQVNMKGYNIDDYEPGAFANGGQIPYYQEGSEHEMTMKEIKQLEKMGYKLKY